MEKYFIEKYDILCRNTINVEDGQKYQYPDDFIIECLDRDCLKIVEGCYSIKFIVNKEFFKQKYKHQYHKFIVNKNIGTNFFRVVGHNIFFDKNDYFEDYIFDDCYKDNYGKYIIYRGIENGEFFSDEITIYGEIIEVSLDEFETENGWSLSDGKCCK